MGFDRCLHLGLMHARAGHGPRQLMGLRRNPAGLPHPLQFMGLLAQPQPMQDRRRRHQPQGRLAGSGVAVELSPPGREHQRFHRGVAANAEGDRFSPIEKLRQASAQLIQGQGDVCAVTLHGPFSAPAETGPHLRRRILGLHEQHEPFPLGAMGQQQSHRIRFIKSSQIKEVAVLAEGPLTIGVMGNQRGRRDHSCGRTKLIEETLPPAGVDAGVEVVHAGVNLS